MEENKVSNFLFDIIEKDLADGVYGNGQLGRFRAFQ